MMTKAPSQKRDETAQKSGSPARFKGRPRGPSAIKQREVATTLRACRQVGGVRAVKVTRDGISIILADEQAPSSDANPWDEVLTHAEDEERSS